jgi:macrolide transport system ATP-binding/permease protein
MREWIWRIKAMLGRERMAAEKAEELELHIAMEVEAGLRQGFSAEEARRRARLRAGLVSEGMESAREELGFRWLDGAATDLRHAIRALTRNRGFGTVAVLALSAGVAINTLIFCMLDGVVLKPLPYRSPKQLVRLYDSTAGAPKFAMALGRYLDYRANAKSLESIALYTGGSMELTASRGHSKQLISVAITPDYFAVLGKMLFLGRPFTPADLHAGVRNVIISYRLWRDRFQSDHAIVGKIIHLDRAPWTVVGVAPDGFQHIGGDYRSPLQGETVDIWAPLTLDGPEMMIRAYHFCNAVARIREGLTAAQARKELEILAARYSQHYPDFGKWTVRMEPLLNEVTGRSRQVVGLLAAAGGLVLLVACANIAGLCLARAVARQRELSLRRALGANRWQLIRVGLAENLLIGVAGAIFGLLLANAGLPLLRRRLPEDFPRAHEIVLTGMGAAFATAIALATALIAGLLPLGARDTLQSQRITSGRDSRRLRTVLVAGEIALAGLLCAGALFLLRSYWEIGARDHGFNPAGALTFHLKVPATSDTKPGALARVYEAIVSKIGEIPGVVSVGASTNLPWSGYDENSGFEIVGEPADRNNDKGGRYQAATPGYFEAAGMRLLNGRLFNRARDARGQPSTLIVNDALANRYFPNGRALGALVRVAGQNRRIIGVVEGIQDSPADLDTKPAFWFPFEQGEYDSVFFAIRSASVDPVSLTPAVTAAVHAVDPELALDEVRTLQSRADSTLAGRRFALWLFQSFAILALALAAVGIYGLLAYTVQQRQKELGIRAALGASRTDLWKMILSDGVKMASAGAFCCLLLAPLGGSLLRTFLYNVKAFDLLTIAGAPAILLTIAVLASLGPARTAMHGDPAFALRED